MAGTLLEVDRAALELGLEALVQENERSSAPAADGFRAPAGTVCGGNLYRRADGPILSSYPDLGQSYNRQIDALQNSWVLRMNPASEGHYHGTQ